MKEPHSSIIETEVYKFLQQRGWDNLKPGDIAKSISIESAELLEHFQWTNPEMEELKKNKVKSKEVAEEAADIMLYCLNLFVLLGIDHEKAIRNKIIKIRKKYPAKKILSSAKGKKYGENDDYWKIKKEYRNNDSK